MTDTENLFDALLAIRPHDFDNGDEGWTLVCALRKQATPEVYARATALVNAENPHRRTVGINILAQFGVTQTTPNPHTADICTLLLARIQAETDTNALHAILVAFGHLKDPRAIPELIRHAAHPDDTIRDVVARSLGPFADDATAAACLFTLMRDPYAPVRDWATFGIGHPRKDEHPGTIDALRERLTDPDDATQGEALCGLARRRDKTSLPALLVGLHREVPSDYALEAAEIWLGNKFPREQAIAGLEALLP